MRPYHCFLNETTLDFVLGKIQPATTLNLFVNVMRSNVYGYFTDNVPLPGDPGVAVASTLDALLMAGAVYQAGLNFPPPHIDDPYQGCLKQKAQIPEAVIIVFAAVTVTTIFVLLHWVVLLRLTHTRVSKGGSLAHGKAFIEHTPNGLLGWMMQAVRSTGAHVKADGLGNWILRPSVDRHRLELRRESPEEYVYLQQASTPLHDQVDVSYDVQKAAVVEISRFE